MSTQKNKPFFSVILAVIILVIAVPVLGAPASQVFKWRLQTYEAEVAETYKDAVRMAEAIDQRSNGRLKITVHPPGILGYPSHEVHRAVGKGFLEMGESQAPGIHEQPVYLIFDQPIFPDLEKFRRGYNTAKHDLEVAAERMKCKLVRGSPKPICNWFSKIPLATAKDWQGKKIRAFSPVLADWLKGMGASPQIIPWAETYTALATGVVLGDSKSPITVIEAKLYEVGNYYCMWPNVPWLATMFVNLDSFKSLPPDLQNILVEEGKKSEDRLWEKQGEIVKNAFAEMKKRGMTIITPAPEEIEKGAKVYQTLLEKWKKEIDPNTRAVLERVEKAVAGK